MPQVDFLSRVAKFPMVHSAMGYASDAYTKTKDMSPALVQRTLSTAENSVSYAMRFAQPVVNTFERPIHAVDTLACKTLDKMEVNLPVITKTPDEIITSTRTYVTDKLHPVQNGVSSAVNTLSITADKLLSNPVGNLALNTMEFAVSTFRNYVDYYIPPVSGDDEKDGDKVMDVPTEPSQKILWSIRRSYDSILMAQHRVSLRAQHVLHDLGLNGLLTVGYLIDLFQWVMANWKEIAFVGLPSKLNQLANKFRGKDETIRPGNTMEDVTFLAGYWMKKCVELLRNALAVTYKMANSDAVLALRMQLSIALAIALDSVSRIVMIISSKDVVEKGTQFLKSDLPLIYKALMTVKSLTVKSKVHVA